MKRYFHVAFSHSQGFGSLQYVVNNGKYPTLKELKQQCVDDTTKEAIIINIIELSEIDFNQLIS